MGYYESYDYSNLGSNGIATVLMVYLLIFVVWGIYSLLCYIIKGIGLYTIAKDQGEDYPWLAFVPFARTYLQGELGGEIVLKKKSIRNPGIWLIVLPFIEGAVFMIFYLLLFGVIGFSAYTTMGYSNSYMGAGSIGTILFLTVLFIVVIVAGSAVNQVLKVMVNHQILERFTTKNMSIIHAIFMSLIPLYEPLCLFIMSRRVATNMDGVNSTFEVQRGLMGQEAEVQPTEVVQPVQPESEVQPVEAEQPDTEVQLDSEVRSAPEVQPIEESDKENE